MIYVYGYEFYFLKISIIKQKGCLLRKGGVVELIHL